MQFLKKHYEKILLSVALLILAGTAVWLFLTIEKKKEELDITLSPPTKTKKVAPLDLATYDKALEQLKNPPEVSLAAPHHLFNPVTWKEKSDGTLVKVVNQDLPKIVKITPLSLIISFEGVSGAGDNVTGYKFGVTREAAPRSSDRKKVQRYVSATGKKNTDVFTLKEVQGPPENPKGFQVVLNDSNETAVILPGKPYKRVEGYAADLKYDLENKSFNDVRPGSQLVFGGERYKVIAINENEVTVQADSNQKQLTIRWKTTP